MHTTTNTSPFEPVEISGLSLRNRLVMAPMTRSRAIGNIPNDMMATYYAQRASAGLIITEGISPSPNGLGYARIPGIFTDEQINGWKKVTEAVHAKGGKIFAQLMHTGRVSHPANMPEGSRVISSSSATVDGGIWTDTLGMQPYATPEPMTAEDIAATIREHAQAAKNAIAAGFDGVEIHGANGYLLEQFLNPHVNTRTDAYGGNIARRLQFVFKVVDAVIEAVGKDKVGIRLSPFNQFNAMPAYPETVETYETLVKEMDDRKILYVHVIESSARTSNDGEQLLSTMRTTFSGWVIVNGGYSRESIEATLDTGRADLVSLGVPFIANPDLVHRLNHNLALNTPNPEAFYTPDDKGYIDYPYYQN